MLTIYNYIILYIAKCWWDKILMNLANRRYVTKINSAKNLPLNTKFIAPVMIISGKHGRLTKTISIA